MDRAQGYGWLGGGERGLTQSSISKSRKLTCPSFPILLYSIRRVIICPPLTSISSNLSHFLVNSKFRKKDAVYWTSSALHQGLRNHTIFHFPSPCAPTYIEFFFPAEAMNPCTPLARSSLHHALFNPQSVFWKQGTPTLKNRRVHLHERFLDNLKQSGQKIWPHCVCLPKGHHSAWMRPPFPLDIDPQCPCPLYSIVSWTETWCQPPSITPLTQFWFRSTWMSLYSASLVIVDWEASTGGAYGRQHMSLWNYRLFPYA